jgi:H/ACA ribonucleoprotein complex subunit 3
MGMALSRCPVCGDYTLENACSSCGGNTERAGPARYSPEDRYGSYRRALKKQAEGQEDNE